MTALDLWNRHRQHLSRVAAIGLTLDVSRMRFDDGFLERMTPAHAARVRGHGRAGSAAPSPTRTRSAWSATTGCERRTSLPRRRSPPRYARRRPTSRRSLPASMPASIHPPTATTIHARAVHRHRRLRAGPDVRRRCPWRPGRGPDAGRLHRQHRPGRHRAHAATPGGPAR